jgi:cytochrome c-type biogenesis protein CcmF
MPYVGVVLAGIQLFFLTLNNFVASPFQVFGRWPTERRDAMDRPRRRSRAQSSAAISGNDHSSADPVFRLHRFRDSFRLRAGALLGRYPGEKWIHLTRRWTMIAWGFQGVGILLGAHWAYAVLGWGGYWAWDPVENASLMPWLTATAFLHSVMMQEKRGMMRVWNVWLVFITFMLTIIGTTLTRTGLVSSVHAFAQSDIGPWFFGFIGLMLSWSAWWPTGAIAITCAAITAGFAGIARVQLPVQQSDSAGGLLSRCFPGRSSRCSPNGFAAPRSAWARRFSTR